MVDYSYSPKRKGGTVKSVVQYFRGRHMALLSSIPTSYLWKSAIKNV
jgi:hypothetical protein